MNSCPCDYLFCCILFRTEQQLYSIWYSIWFHMFKVSGFQLIYINLIFLFRLFSYSSFWQLKIHSSFVINPMNNYWKCFSFRHFHIYVLWDNVWKSLDYVIYTCIASLLFLKDYVITYKKGSSKITFWLWICIFIMNHIFFSDGPTLEIQKW